MKQAFLALPDMTKRLLRNFRRPMSSQDTSSQRFRTAGHFACLQEGRTVVQKRSILRSEEDLEETLVGGLVQGAR